HDRDCKIRDGGPGSHSIPENKHRTNRLRKSLAEWRRRALGGELPSRATRPCDCSQRAASEASPCRVRLLPSRGRTHLGLGKGTPGCGTRCVTSGGCLRMIAWVGCITVTIGRPSPKTSRSILLIDMCSVDVWACMGNPWLG